MNSFVTLIKLAKTRVDEQRQLLAKLKARLEEIESGIAELEIRKAREQLAVQKDPASAITYDAFLKWAIKLSQELEKQRVTAAQAVVIAHERLVQLFEEQKRFELAEEARLEEERQEEQRRETIDLDEIGSVSYLRKKRK